MAFTPEIEPSEAGSVRVNTYVDTSYGKDTYYQVVAELNEGWETDTITWTRIEYPAEWTATFNETTQGINPYPTNIEESGIYEWDLRTKGSSRYTTINELKLKCVKWEVYFTCTHSGNGAIQVNNGEWKSFEQMYVNYGEKVKINAKPDEGYMFHHWTYDLQGETEEHLIYDKEYEYTITERKNVYFTAHFVEIDHRILRDSSTGVILRKKGTNVILRYM